MTAFEYFNNHHNIKPDESFGSKLTRLFKKMNYFLPWPTATTTTTSTTMLMDPSSTVDQYEHVNSAWDNYNSLLGEGCCQSNHMSSCQQQHIQQPNMKCCNHMATTAMTNPRPQTPSVCQQHQQQQLIGGSIYNSMMMNNSLVGDKFSILATTLANMTPTVETPSCCHRHTPMPVQHHQCSTPLQHSRIVCGCGRNCQTFAVYEEPPTAMRTPTPTNEICPIHGVAVTRSAVDPSSLPLPPPPSPASLPPTTTPSAIASASFASYGDVGFCSNCGGSDYCLMSPSLSSPSSPMSFNNQNILNSSHAMAAAAAAAAANMNLNGFDYSTHQQLHNSTCQNQCCSCCCCSSGAATNSGFNGNYQYMLCY